MGFIFVPLTTMAMGNLENRQIGGATGIYNLMRNLGGSVGIAAATTLLARNTQRHQAILVQHVTPYDPAYQERLADLTSALAAQLGPGAASEQAQQVIYQMIQRQAALLSFIDNFHLIALLCLACVPLVFLFRKVRASKAPVAVH
jgi:DHA2 family multidrug resistance protein